MSLGGRITERVAWLLRSSILRLSLLLSGLFALGFIVAILLALILGGGVLERRIDSTLQTIARAATLDDERADEFSAIVRSPDDIDDLPEPFQRVARRGGGTVDLNKDFRRSETWRVLVAEDSQGSPILIAVPFDDSEEALELLAGVLWATASVVIVSALAIGLGAGTLAQRRLARIEGTLSDLAAGDLTARTGNSRSKDDLDDIAQQLDTTAVELERLVSQTRHLSASIAHDLRTPLARLQARLEMLPDGEERSAALEEAGRLSDVFDAIMRVARIEAAHGSEGFEQVDLGELVDQITEIYGPVVEDAGKSLTVAQQQPSQVMADRQMLIQAMANLIQNALVHGGDVITVIAEGPVIGLADNGPGVEPEDFQEIVKPLVRLDPARTTEGSGLGLALVRAVADRHNAEMVLSKVKPQGLRVSLNFAKK